MSSSSGRRSSRQKVQATGSAKKTTKDEKESIYLEHACYICGETKNNAKQTIGHIEKAHSYQIPSRSGKEKNCHSFYCCFLLIMLFIF